MSCHLVTAEVSVAHFILQLRGNRGARICRSQFDLLFDSVAVLLCPCASIQHRSYRAPALKQENQQHPPEEIYEAGELTTHCSVPQGTTTAPALISFAAEGLLNGDKCCAASNFKDRRSRLLRSGVTRRARRTSGATWRGGTGAGVTDVRTDAQSRDRRAPRQGAR